MKTTKIPGKGQTQHLTASRVGALFCNRANTRVLRTAFAVLLLGAATGNILAASMPPMPIALKARTVRWKAPNTPAPSTPMARFTPAAAGDEVRPVYIYAVGPDLFGVLGVQTNAPGGTLEFLGSQVVTGPFMSLATPQYVNQGETLNIYIPNWHDLNYCVVVRSVQGPPPAGLVPAAALVDSGRTLKWRGKTWRMFRLPGSGMPVYLLKA